MSRDPMSRGPMSFSCGSRGGRRRSGGFTLLEVLIASAIGAVLLLLTAHVFHIALEGKRRIESQGADLARLRRTFEVIGRDMHNAVLPPDDANLQFGQSAQTGSNTFQLATAVADPMLVSRSANETALVTYAIAPDPATGGSTLWRYETAYPAADSSQGGTGTNDPDTHAVPLLPGVANAAYYCYSEDQQTWLDNWENQPGLPTAVRVDLQLGQPNSQGIARRESWTFWLPAVKYQSDQLNQAQSDGAASP